MDNVGRITFDNCPMVPINPYGKVETLEKVWLFESGEFYDAPHLKKIYASKEVALLKVPDNFIFAKYSTSKNLYYESHAQWIKISEMQIEKE